MEGFKRGRWWITAGVLLGMPSLFWFGFGRMQNVYGALLLVVGLLCLRRGGKWNKMALIFGCALLAVLLVAFNEFLHGMFGLWAVGALTTLTYSSLAVAAQKALLPGGRQKAARRLWHSCILILLSHAVYLLLGTWCPLGPLGVLPLVAQLYMLVLLWLYGRPAQAPQNG